GCSGSKDGRHQCEDFLHRIIEFECKTRHVDILEIAMLLLEDLPGGIVHEIYFSSFIVSVTKTTRAAEDVAQVDYGDQRLTGFAPISRMATCEDVNHFPRAMPLL